MRENVLCLGERGPLEPSTLCITRACMLLPSVLCEPLDKAAQSLPAALT